jgi:glycosyltransferase 2 family protein
MFVNAPQPCSLPAVLEHGPKSARVGGFLTVLFKVSVAGVILLYLARTQRLAIKKLEIALQHPWLLLTALLLLLVVPFTLAFRWRLFLRSRRYDVPFRHVLGLTFTAVFFDTLMPGGTADVVRGYLFDRHFQPTRRASAAMTVLIDRFVGVTALVLLAVGALALYSHTALGHDLARAIGWSAALVLLLFLAGFGFLASEKTSGRCIVTAVVQRFPRASLLLHLFDAANTDGGNFSPMVQGLCWSVLGHGLVVFAFALLYFSLGETELSVSDFLFLVPVGLFIAQVPIAPAGIGVGHAAFFSLFALRGSQVGAAAFSLYTLVRFVSSLPGLVYFLVMKRQSQSKQSIPVQDV